jgi:hypothetical protein
LETIYPVLFVAGAVSAGEGTMGAEFSGWL